MTGTEESAERVLVRHAVEDEHQRLLLEVARLQGEVEALRDQRAAAESAAEHHRAELDGLRQEAAEAQAGQRADQARLEEIRRSVADLRRRAEEAEAACGRAERERAAVIAALGRKARRRLGEGAEADSAARA
jgi:chromosome segregation ATPase